MAETTAEAVKSDFLIYPTEIIGRSLTDVERLFPDPQRKDVRNGTHDGNPPASAPNKAATKVDLISHNKANDPSVLALRTYLADNQGKGYWDFFRLSPYLFVSITDATYTRETWIHVPGDRVFKIRLLLSGSLYDKEHKPISTGPSGLLYVLPGSVDDGYYIGKDAPTKMVVLHCKPEMLTDILWLQRQEIPDCLDRFFRVGHGKPSGHRVGLSPEVFRASSDIIASRYRYTSPLRNRYLEAKCQEIICTVIQELNDKDMEHAGPLQRVSKRDLNRVYEARDILVQHFADPPAIPRLARMVGINQTKLKSSFKDAIGLTIYDFIQQCRMEKASEMLLSGDHTISDAAYTVGYDYPANFTQAFKKYYGFLPKALKHIR